METFQPAVSRTPRPNQLPIPAMNRWAIFIRPLTRTRDDYFCDRAYPDIRRCVGLFRGLFTEAEDYSHALGWALS